MPSHPCPACGSRHCERLGTDCPPRFICEICWHIRAAPAEHDQAEGRGPPAPPDPTGETPAVKPDQ
jgi:hypothetical protein